jgi:putative endonuclease
MSHRRQALGKAAEDRAARELERRGYAVLARRYRTRHGEIDIIARDGTVTVFVEVRARSTAERGTAAESVTPLKQHRLVRMAADYAARHRLNDSPCRFDVVCIDGAEGEGPVVTVHRGAFDASGR